MIKYTTTYILAVRYEEEKEKLVQKCKKKGKY